MSELSIRSAGAALIEVRVHRVCGEERERAAELALRLAAEVAGARPGQLRLDHAPDGRPIVRGARVEVSISHGQGVIAVAVSAAAASATGRIGVDVEALRPLPVDLLARRWLRPEETQWLGRRAPADRSPAFLWLWTQKEALGKAAGRGLAGGAGLLLAVPLPECWPPQDALFADPGRLLAVPDRPDLAVAAALRGDGLQGGVRGGLAVAVAAFGPGVTGALVRADETFADHDED